MGLFSRKSSVVSENSSSLKNRSLTNRTSATSMGASSKLSFFGKKSKAAPSTSNMSLAKPPDPRVDPAAYLRSIQAVRERTRIVLDKAKANKLTHFVVDMSKFQECADYVVMIIKRDFAPDFASIPPHGRWQHFEVGGNARIDNLLASWPTSVNQEERTRRLLDLFLVSVLLDAGAGTKWQYKTEEGKVVKRSEGLAVASLDMFKAGLFSSDPDNPHQVDGKGLKTLTIESLAKGLQASEENPLAGLEGRAGLLMKLGGAMDNEEIFGQNGRPGNMLDYFMSYPAFNLADNRTVPLPRLWHVVMEGLAPIWPKSRTTIDGVSLGDAWPCSSMPPLLPGREWESIAPFHKLSQWLTYSLMVPMAKLMGIRFEGVELMTGLPEYRNGGLLVDTGVLTLKKDDAVRGIDAYHENCFNEGRDNRDVVPLFTPDDDVIVEWRAATVGFLDDLLVAVNKGLGLQGGRALSLAQMLEAGTWKGGRELAAMTRPCTGDPPIMIDSDGTVF